MYLSISVNHSGMGFKIQKGKKMTVFYEEFI